MRTSNQGLQPRQAKIKFFTAVVEEHFLEGKKEIGRTIVNRGSMVFRWLKPFTERSLFFFLLALAAIREYKSSPFWSQSIFAIEISVYFFSHFPPLIKIFESITDQESDFLVSVLFYCSVSGKTLPG